jgi:S1-C subfamily serine protease
MVPVRVRRVMGQHRLTTAVFVVALLIGSVAPIALGVPGLTSQAGGDASNIQDSCNYQQLYNETIDSVVAVTRGQGGGTGFVIETAQNGSANLVVTNAHVVGDASSVIIEFREGDQINGTVVGTDRLTDLAVVRVSRMPSYVESFQVASSLPDPGRKVAALGHPFGLDETITSGIISGTDRALPTTEGFTLPQVLQTDAAISPGNSGGPLVTCDGTVVGVNTAGLSRQRAENIGFAVPATVVSEVVPELIENGDAEHAYLGVAAIDVTPAIVQVNDLNTTQGAYVTAVAEGAPVAETLQGATGVEYVSDTRVPIGGDIIVAADGRAIESVQDLKEFLLLSVEPGETTTLTVLRDGERTNVTVTLAERPEPGSA